MRALLQTPSIKPPPPPEVLDHYHRIYPRHYLRLPTPVMSSRRLKSVLLQGLPILEQLVAEELLLRTTRDNFLLVNRGMPSPAIVLGFSGKIKELVNVELVARDGIQLIRRYTGGGTVICDENTLFVTFIMNTADADTKPYPRDIMDWSGGIYRNVFARHQVSDFDVRENDYVFGNAKFGGNAQTITKDRWVHHTSFLYDYDRNLMDYLTMPKKQPTYRSNREHSSFLTKMKQYVPSVDSFVKELESEMSKSYILESISQSDLLSTLNSIKLERRDLASLIRTKEESVQDCLQSPPTPPSLVRFGPSCVNI